MTPITSLPTEILSPIHQALMDTAKNDPAPALAKAGQQSPPLTRVEQARRAAAARANFVRVCKRFQAVDKDNLSLPKNAEIRYQVAQNAICNEQNAISNAIGDFAKLDDEHFTQGVRALLEDKQNLAVDFSPLSSEQTRIVLDLLVEQANNKPLHRLRFEVNMDRPSSALLNEINEMITTIRETEAGADTAVEFACSSHDKGRVDPPDFSGLTNLTSVDLSGCINMEDEPDFSENLVLTVVNLSRTGLSSASDFSRNPELTVVDLSHCALNWTPSFSSNSALTSLNLSHTDMINEPDFSRNPALKSLDLSYTGLDFTVEDFSENLALESVDLRECDLSDTARTELRELLGDRLIM